MSSGRASEDRQAAFDLLWEITYPMCERINARARVAGWQVPPGPARITYAGTLDAGLYTVIVGRKHSEPIRHDTPDLENHLYAVYESLLEAAGVARRDGTP